MTARFNPDLIEDVEWLVGTDWPPRIAYRLGFNTPEALATRLRRMGRYELAQFFLCGGAR